MKAFISLLCGLLFSFGLAISGMTNPQNVINFLDISGNWDPALMFVMVGAIGVHSIAHVFRKTKLQTPLVASDYSLPSKNKIDKKLILGSAMFGAGWGLVGFCPAPAIASITGFDKALLIFVASLFVGMKLFTLTNNLKLEKLRKQLKKKYWFRNCLCLR